jgi:hypothetical protein
MNRHVAKLAVFWLFCVVVGGNSRACEPLDIQIHYEWSYDLPGAYSLSNGTDVLSGGPVKEVAGGCGYAWYWSGESGLSWSFSYADGYVYGVSNLGAATTGIYELYAVGWNDSNSWDEDYAYVVVASPKCDNCHTVSENLFECGHYTDTPEGAPCATDWCIRNYMDTATCDYHGPDWPNPTKRCDTCLVYPLEPDLIQERVDTPCPGPPQNVHWTTDMITYWGCDDACIANEWRNACETFGCPGEASRSYERGLKMKCGCP